MYDSCWTNMLSSLTVYFDRGLTPSFISMTLGLTTMSQYGYCCTEATNGKTKDVSLVQKISTISQSFKVGTQD